jgi:CHAT domain-containing protein/tetratricopeptide (TPR) repeat protein
VDRSFCFEEEVNCPHCGRRSQVRFWPIVDVGHRRDLAVEIELGTLNTSLCPSCGRSFSGSGPLLVGRFDDPAWLLFSPAPDMTRQESAPYLDRLMDQLGVAAGDPEIRLGPEDVTWVLRAALPCAMFDRGAAPIEHPDPWSPVLADTARLTYEWPFSREAELTEAMRTGQLLADEGDEDPDSADGAQTRGVGGLQRVISEHGALRSRAIDLLLAQYVEADWLSAMGRRRALERRLLLWRCREIGVDEAFAERAAAQTAASDDPKRLKRTVRALLAVFNAEGWDAAMRSVQKHQDELAPGWVGVAMESMARRYAGNIDALVHVQEVAAWLWRCRREGVAAAFANLRRAAEVHDQLGHENRPDRVITVCRTGLAIADRDAEPDYEARLHQRCADACLELQSGQAENAEQAVGHYQAALEAVSRIGWPDGWAHLHRMLAVAYGRRVLGDRDENLRQAYAHARVALAVYSRETHPAEWAGVYIDLGLIHAARAEIGQLRSGYADTVREAIAHIEHALPAITGDEYRLQWAGGQVNLATLKLRLGGRSHARQAIRHYRAALTVYNHAGAQAESALMQAGLGLAYRERGEGQADIARAVRHYGRALSVLTVDRFPADRHRVATELGEMHFAQGDWELALTAYRQAIEAGAALAPVLSTKGGGLAHAQQISWQYAHAAYCLLRLERPAESLEYLERGKARVLNQAMTVRDADLTSLAEPLRTDVRKARDWVATVEARRGYFGWDQGPPDPDLGSQLQAARADLADLLEQAQAAYPGFLPAGIDASGIMALAPEGGALVAFLVTGQGSAAFVLPAGAGTVTGEHVVHLDHDDLVGAGRPLLFGAPERPGWLAAHAAGSDEGRKAVIDGVTRRVWDALMGPVHARLAALGVPPDAAVTIAPHGGLGILPLHAAWREDRGDRRYFSDDYVVTYVPSGGILRMLHLRRAAAGGRDPSLLAVINPTGDLPYATIEGHAVAGYFPAAARMTAAGDDLWPSLVGQARGCSYLHFACHAVHDWQDPTRSALILGPFLTFNSAEILTFLDLTAVKMVVLSACETGLTDMETAPDEFASLPTAFLEVGAQAVTSTLWAVNDRSTAVLVAEFYRLLLTEGQHPASALESARRFLRDATARELAEWFERRYDDSGGTDRAAYEAAADFRSRHNPAERPYPHPFYWAGFVYTGP